ncbi:hypothetical protein [Kribbella sp. NPDC004536]|uniref:hypothetical protein n=1 Tax=Kribbella sp. NPDC004536 TaxID=3364106 RepID=UPI00367E8405
MTEQVPLIVADSPFAVPPPWAVLERQLIATMDAALEPTLRRYVRDDGSLYWPTSDDHVGVDGLDDAYESFFSWPLFYLLGGSDRFLAASHRQFDAITAQFARYQTGFGHPMVVDEYEQGYDWFHQSEGYTFFYYLSMADPDDERTRSRALRFAGLYLNESPQAQNWDPELHLVKAPCTGSMGPAFRNFSGAQFLPFKYFDHLQWAGLPFQDVPGVRRPVDLRDEHNAITMGETMQRRQSRGDVPANLAITSLMTNAYLFTGDPKYRDWITTYSRAWLDRIASNGGVIPDNVGLSGTVGEYLDGKWYGGYYGWTWPTGWESLGSALVCAGENAVLVSGDPAYLDLPRSQLEYLRQRAIVFEGTVHAPTRYGDPGNYELTSIVEGLRGHDISNPLPATADAPLLWHEGWFDYAPVNPEGPTHLWFSSNRDDDRAFLDAVRHKGKPESSTVLDPTAWRSTVRKNQAGHEHPWLAYLSGEYPQYPVDILNWNLAQVHRRLDDQRTDRQDRSTYADQYLQVRNPITVEGLIQLTMGAPMPVYNGGLLMTRIRYFDIDRRRPGLPPDVGALVREVGREHLTVELVNLHGSEARELVIQAGGFGEHRFGTVVHEGKESTVDGRWVRVRLEPGCGVTVRLSLELFVNQPAHGFNW